MLTLTVSSVVGQGMECSFDTNWMKIDIPQSKILAGCSGYHEKAFQQSVALCSRLVKF